MLEPIRYFNKLLVLLRTLDAHNRHATCQSTKEVKNVRGDIKSCRSLPLLVAISGTATFSRLVK